MGGTGIKVRLNHRVVSQAVVIATGVSADGRREVLGCATGDSETEDFWTEFLRDLRDRGLTGVQLVISDAHRGLVNAIGTVLQGVTWQRCWVHFMRNVLAKVSKGHDEMVAATIRTISAQPGQAEVRAHVDLVADMLAGQFPAVAQMLLDAKDDLTAFADFPLSHWRKIWSTTPSNASTARSSEGPTSSGSSRTPQPCAGCRAACLSRPTTSGKTATVAT